GSWTASPRTSSPSRATARRCGARATTRFTKTCGGSAWAKKPTVRTGSNTKSYSDDGCTFRLTQADVPAMMEVVDAAETYEQGRRVVHALGGVSLRIEAGEFVSIMGPSGSGKSTLLHLLGALDTPTRGQVLFGGRDLAALTDRERSLIRRSRIGFIFQFFNLLSTLTAVENVALPLLLA